MPVCNLYFHSAEYYDFLRFFKKIAIYQNYFILFYLLPWRLLSPILMPSPSFNPFCLYHVNCFFYIWQLTNSTHLFKNLILHLQVKRCEITSQRLFPAFEHSQKSNCFFAPQESSKIKNGLNNAEIYLYDARMINSYASSTFMRTKKKPSLPLFTTKSSLFHGYCPFK